MHRHTKWTHTKFLLLQNLVISNVLGTNSCHTYPDIFIKSVIIKKMCVCVCVYVKETETERRSVRAVIDLKLSSLRVFFHFTLTFTLAWAYICSMANEIKLLGKFPFYFLKIIFIWWGMVFAVYSIEYSYWSRCESKYLFEGFYYSYTHPISWPVNHINR